MDDRTTQTQDDLFEDISGSEADDTASHTSQEDDELNGAFLEDEESTNAKANEARQKQIDAWTRKIESGESTLDSMPSNLNWLKPFVQKQIQQKESINEEKIASKLDELVEQKLAKRQAQEEFERLKAELKTFDLSKDQKDELNSTFKTLTSEGVAPNKALQIALKASGIDRINQARRSEELRLSMAIPRGGNYQAPKQTELNNDNYHNVSPEDRLKALERMRRGN